MGSHDLTDPGNNGEKSNMLDKMLFGKAGVVLNRTIKDRSSSYINCVCQVGRQYFEASNHSANIITELKKNRENLEIRNPKKVSNSK